MSSEAAFRAPHAEPDLSLPSFDRPPEGYWDAGFDPEQFVLEAADDLRRAFSAERLEETAFTVYTSGLKAARWLGFARVHLAHRYARSVGPVRTAVDFGSGLGVSLPGLSARAERVYAVDRDTEITGFIVDRLKLPNVVVVPDVEEIDEPIDLLYSLDVFEHVLDLPGLVAELASRTRDGGSWVVSGPTENRLYHLARAVARTTGEGHIRGIDRVFDLVSERLCMDESAGLPVDLPMPLTLHHVALFHKPA